MGSLHDSPVHTWTNTGQFFARIGDPSSPDVRLATDVATEHWLFGTHGDPTRPTGPEARPFATRGDRALSDQPASVSDRLPSIVG
jgi:hypothetical protein